MINPQQNFNKPLVKFGIVEFKEKESAEAAQAAGRKIPCELKSLIDITHGGARNIYVDFR